MKGQMLGSRSLEDDISLAHSVYASSLQSEVSGRGPTPLPPPLRAQPTAVIVLPVAGTGSVLALGHGQVPLGFTSSSVK